MEDQKPATVLGPDALAKMDLPPHVYGVTCVNGKTLGVFYDREKAESFCAKMRDKGQQFSVDTFLTEDGGFTPSLEVTAESRNTELAGMAFDGLTVLHEIACACVPGSTISERLQAALALVEQARSSRFVHEPAKEKLNV